MLLTWICSYETYKFNTADGDLGKGQYAKKGNRFIVRRHPKNNYNTISVKQLNPQLDIEEVTIIENEHMYYDEFELPDKRILRIPSNKINYQALAGKNAGKLIKDINQSEVKNIVKNDKDWLNIPVEKEYVYKIK